MYKIKLIKDTEVRKDFVLFLNEVAVGNITMRTKDFKDFCKKLKIKI